MRLPAIPFLTKSVSTEFFLALIFESDKVSSILFKEQEKSLIILASRQAELDLEQASTEDLIVTCDGVISRLEMSLPEGANLEKTIFAVPHSWVDEGKIKAERLSQLKKISGELALIPMGFIVSIEAIIAFLQKKEGAPVSGIFVELSDKMLSVFIARSGNIIDVKTGIVEDAVEKTVEKLLGQVTKLDVLPSKIVLLHNKEAEAVQQKFLSHHWTKELPFMHLPQVAILEKGFENEAIISGVASQLNVTVKGDVEVSTSEEIADEEASVIAIGDNFGFVRDEDVAIKVEPAKVEKEMHEEKDLGFSETISEPVIKHHGIVPAVAVAGEEVFEEDEPEEPRIKKSSPISGIFRGIGSLITPRNMSRFPKMIGSGRKLIIPFIALAVVVVFLILYYSVFLKANITVFTDEKAFKEDSMDITLSTKSDSSFLDKVLKISTIDEEVKGEESQETTGQKDTGQKATGGVTIFNKTESSKEIAKGTTITSSNNLEFTLNDDVKIASTSSFATSFSNTSAKITASSFGKEYNIPSQTNFTIKGISTSDVFARNDSAFSGGTKEEIQVVAKKDLDALEDTVTKRLFEKAKSQASSSLAKDDALVPIYLSADFKDKVYDRKENDQAKSVKLSATIEYTLGVYKKEELTKFISSSSDFDVPADFKLSDDDSSIKISDIKQNKNDVSAKLSFNAIFKPQLEIENLPAKITGKGKEEAVKILKTTSGVSDVNIQFTGSIPFLPQIIPLSKASITIEEKTQ